MTEKALTKKENIFGLMAVKYNLDKEDFKNTVKATLMPKDKNGNLPSDSHIAAFLIVAHQYNLNPFTNEIYAYPDKSGGITPVVGIDGFSAILNSNKDYDGMDIEFAPEEITPEGGKKCPEWCEVKIYKKGITKPIVAREWLDEVYVAPRSGFSGPWQTHTKRMLRHKAIIQAVRLAFGITGIFDEDEAKRISDSQAIETSLVTLKPEVEIPKEITPEKPIDNAYKTLLDNFAKAKKKLGDETYYRILGDFGYEHANQCRKIEEGIKILGKMKEEYEKETK